MPRTEFIVLSSTQSLGQQSVTLLQLLSFGKHKLRLTIKSDAYKFQSHARVEVMETSPAIKWNVLVYRPHGDMKTPEGLCYHSGAGTRNFMPAMGEDRLWLLDQTRLLLG
jgi:hypothetical protein